MADHMKCYQRLEGNMAQLSWEARYGLNIVSIDLQHRMLVDMSNQLYRSIISNGTNKATQHSLDELLKHTIFHFAFEEKLMAACCYPGLDQHKAEHAGLLQQFEAVRADIVGGQLPLNSGVMNFLQGWLTHHIVSCDSHYALFVKERPARLVPQAPRVGSMAAAIGRLIRGGFRVADFAWESAGGLRSRLFGARGAAASR